MFISIVRNIQRVLSLPFFVAAHFTGLEVKYVSIQDTVKSFDEILSGELDDLPEQAFYLVGSIDEAKDKAGKLG